MITQHVDARFEGERRRDFHDVEPEDEILRRIMETQDDDDEPGAEAE